MERLSDIRTVNSLRDYTEKIKEALAQASNQFIYIGFLLDEADRFEVYQQSGFDSIYDYCETIFGFKRSSTNNFIRVYRQFGEGIGLQEKFSRYSYSQLTEMCSMDRQQISQCAPEMSVRAIREIKKKPVYQQVISLDQSSEDLVQTSGKEAIDFETLDVAIGKCSVSQINNKNFIRVSARQLCNLWLELTDKCGVMDTIGIYEPDNWNDDLNYFVLYEGV